jgi:hypothetical protein
MRLSRLDRCEVFNCETGNWILATFIEGPINDPGRRCHGMMMVVVQVRGKQLNRFLIPEFVRPARKKTSKKKP